MSLLIDYFQKKMSSFEQDDDNVSASLEAEPSVEITKVTKNSRKQGKEFGRNLEHDLLDKAVRRCWKGERNCRACAKGMDHDNLPAYVKCAYCGATHGFYRVRTGRHARERVYLEDRDGRRIARYNANGDFAGYRWREGDKMYYDDGTPVPETRKVTACSSDSCKFYKIPIKEVEKYDRMTGGKLDKI